MGVALRTYEELYREARPGIRKALEELGCEESSGKVRCRRVHLLLNFPTGYGKSTISIVLGRMLQERPTTNFARVIHVVPTRSLVEDLWRRAKAHVRGAVQYGFAPMDIKAPYFLPPLTITTYDSYTLNLFKAAIAEPGSEYGHFELPRFAIYSSLTHLDEYHLLAFSDDEEGDDAEVAWTTLTTAIRQLASAGVQLILSTATPSRALEEELAKTLATYSPRGTRVVTIHVVPSIGVAASNRQCERTRCSGDLCEYTCRVRVGSHDVEYTLVEVVDNPPAPKIEIGEIKRSQLVEEVKKLLKEDPCCGCAPRLLVVANTVRRAVEYYEELRRQGIETCLIHSRFAGRDRERVLESVKQCDVLVATQVVEVGVDLNACSMVTDAAPLPALVQRAGRVLRSPNCANCVGKILIITDVDHKPYDAEQVQLTIDQLRGMEWRICIKQPYGCHNRPGYADLVNRLYQSPPRTNAHLEAALTMIDDDAYSTRHDLEPVLKKICGLVRTSALVTLAAPGYDLSHVDKLRESLLTVSGTTLFNTLRSVNGDICRVLKCSSDGIHAIFAAADPRGGRRIIEAPSKRLRNLLEKAYQRSRDVQSFNKAICSRLRNYVERVDGSLGELVAIVVNQDAYSGEKGLWPA